MTNQQNAAICIAHRRLKVAMRRFDRLKSVKCVSGRGSALDPAGGAHSTPKTPSRILWDREESGEEKERDGRERKGRGGGNGGEGGSVGATWGRCFVA